MAKASDKYRNWFASDKLVSDLMDEAADDIDERDAEIERLREALQKIAKPTYGSQWFDSDEERSERLFRWFFHAQKIARVALQQKDTK